jgi:hypothetical protein
VGHASKDMRDRTFTAPIIAIRRVALHFGQRLPPSE